ncbi:lysostaphin resistance A-like protein [Oceanobacillus kapialis]|uniref:CPBP family intramembrane glutamic endopeptidase n=1 Tax=Oceanobacillus kapialis TaxID=481353 RepID=UPI00384F6771
MDNFLVTKWTFKDLTILLVFVFLVVPLTIEGYLQNLLNDLFQHELYAGTLTGVVMAVLCTISIYVTVLKPYQYGWEEVGLQPFRKQYWKSIINWTLCLIVMSVAIVIIMDYINMGTDNAKTRSLKQDLNWINFLIGFVSAAIISPLYEEILYRGFLYKWFRIKWGVVPGLCLSSIIFTLVHIPTYNTLPVNFVSGLIFAWTYEKTNSIIPAIIIHGTFNGIAVILTVIA